MTTSSAGLNIGLRNAAAEENQYQDSQMSSALQTSFTSYPLAKRITHRQLCTMCTSVQKKML